MSRWMSRVEEPDEGDEWKSQVDEEAGREEEEN